MLRCSLRVATRSLLSPKLVYTPKVAWGFQGYEQGEGASTSLRNPSGSPLGSVRGAAAADHPDGPAPGGGGGGPGHQRLGHRLLPGQRLGSRDVDGGGGGVPCTPRVELFCSQEPEETNTLNEGCKIDFNCPSYGEGGGGGGGGGQTGCRWFGGENHLFGGDHLLFGGQRLSLLRVSHV